MPWELAHFLPVRTWHLATLNTSFSVSPQHFPAGQYLTTLVTWELLSSVHPHVFHQPVVCFKGLLTHQTVLGLSRNSMQLVGDLSNVPGLSTLRKVLPTKNSNLQGSCLELQRVYNSLPSVHSLHNCISRIKGSQTYCNRFGTINLISSKCYLLVFIIIIDY